MRTTGAFPMIAVLMLMTATAALGDDQAGPGAGPPIAPIRKSAAAPAPAVAPEAEAAREAEAMAFVREHHPELGSLLEALKPMNPGEYRKAIGELSQVGRTLAALKVRNPARYLIVLDTWKARSRVEVLAAQLAGNPDEETRSQLRSAIEAKVDSEIRRQRFELEQAELAAKKAREALDRLEPHRDAIVEARFRALQPRKSPRGKKPAPALGPRPTTPANTSTTSPIGEDRR